MKKLAIALMIGLSSSAVQAEDIIPPYQPTMDWNAAEANAQAAISRDPVVVQEAPRNTGGWASCSYGVCNGYNNDGSNWWSSDAGGTIQYFYNR
jgi:hypothetical protein